MNLTDKKFRKYKKLSNRDPSNILLKHKVAKYEEIDMNNNDVLGNIFNEMHGGADVDALVRQYSSPPNLVDNNALKSELAEKLNMQRKIVADFVAKFRDAYDKQS